ncbi:pleckstrin homology-like domain family A member 2 [Hemicordylus capensis]|nr:pleckstrin homology-like domain family A member 2 [Hemicordylus capensis]
MKGPACVSASSEVIREGELEKRSDSLFQLWKKKLVVLSKDSLSLFSPEGGSGGGKARAKELRFGSIQKVDCVERTGKYVYFTIVTTDRKEIDFRCPGESCWNASITMALIDFQNKRAIQDFKSRQQQEAVEQAAAGTRDSRRLARAP